LRQQSLYYRKFAYLKIYSQVSKLATIDHGTEFFGRDS
jgi:hypothetical protein